MPPFGQALFPKEALVGRYPRLARKGTSSAQAQVPAHVLARKRLSFASQLSPSASPAYSPVLEISPSASGADQNKGRTQENGSGKRLFASHEPKETMGSRSGQPLALSEIRSPMTTTPCDAVHTSTRCCTVHPSHLGKLSREID